MCAALKSPFDRTIETIPVMLRSYASARLMYSSYRLHSLYQ